MRAKFEPVNTILLLTDLSEAASKAANITLGMAAKLRSELHLLPSVYIERGNILRDDEVWTTQGITLNDRLIKDQLQREMERLRNRTILTDQEQTAHRPFIMSFNAKGGLPDISEKKCSEKNVGMSVVCYEAVKDEDLKQIQILLTFAQSIKVPLLVLPTGTQLEYKAEINYATDLSNNELGALQWLNGFAGQLGYKLLVTHVSHPVLVPDFREELEIDEFSKRLHKISPLIRFRNLRGDDIPEALEASFTAQKSVILAISNRKHSFSWGLFHDSTFMAILEHFSRPLLILPDIKT